MKRKALSLVTVAGIAIVMMSGCSSDTGIKALEREATPEDALPTFVTVQEPANPDTARLVATHEDTRFFILQSDDKKTACLAAIPPGNNPNWQLGCGQNNGPGEIFEMDAAGGAKATLLADGSDTGKVKTGWTQISDNVLIPSP